MYQRLETALGSLIGGEKPIKGTLGYTIDGAYRVTVAENAAKYYVRFADGSFAQVYHRGRVSPVPDLPVEVGYDSAGNMVITGGDPDRAGLFAGAHEVGPHSHARGSGMEFAIDTRLLTPVKAAPLAGLTVSVAQGAYRHNGALRWWGGGAITLTPPGSANQWAWVAIGLDPAAGALVAASGSSVVVSAPLESSTIPAISLSGAILLAAVRVRNGQTELDEADFEDLRFSLVTVPVLLDDLNNVDTSGASDGEVLTYDSGMWIAQAPPGASFSGDAFDVPYTPTTGGDWTEGAPSDVGDGLDILAARSPGGGGTQDYILIRDEKAQGTPSGTFTAGAWRTRDLNTEVADTGGHASVASNQITLAAGTYRVFASAPAYVPDRHQLRLYDITHSVVLAIGQSAYTAYGISGSHHGGVAILSGRFTLTETTVIELQHRAQTTGGTLGFGVEANFTTEVYAQVELWKE